MKTSEKVDIALSLEQQCEKVDHYIETMFSGIEKEYFFTVILNMGKSNEFDSFGMGFRLQGELDAQFIELIVDDIQRRLKFFEENQEDMKTSRYCCKFKTAM